MESDDDETLEYDIEIVDSAPVSIESFKQNNPLPAVEPPTRKITEQPVPDANLSKQAQNETENSDRAQTDVNNEPEKVNTETLTGSISDEQRYAELIKDIGELELVEPLPSQSDIVSSPEPPQPLVEDLKPTLEDQLELENLERRQVVCQVSEARTLDDGDDGRENGLQKFDEEIEQASKPDPTVQADRFTDEKEPADTGDLSDEKTNQVAAAEQPSVIDEPMIPLDEPACCSPPTEQDSGSEQTFSQPAVELADKLLAEGATGEAGSSAQPTIDIHDQHEEVDDLTVNRKSDNNIESTETANTDELRLEISEEAKADTAIECPNELELPELELNGIDRVEVGSLMAQQNQNENQPSLTDLVDLVEAKTDNDITLGPTDQIIDLKSVVESESIQVNQQNQVEPTTQIIPADETATDRTEVEQMSYIPSDHIQREIIFEVNEDEEAEVDEIKANNNQVDITIEQIEVCHDPCELEKGGQELDNESNFGGSEDLEWEFDNEPVFEQRQIQVKRDRDPRIDYELGEELGRGRFGTVFRCVEQSSGRKLAAKFVHMRRKEDREDVEREVKIMSLLQHKRLLQLYDALDDGKSEMCLITELVEGGELFERIVNDDFELTEKKAAIFMRQICEGVDYMHSQHIVHLDMKPENILCVSRTGNKIKLIDFGLARQLDENEPLRVMFGTPDFAAPEVLSYDIVSLSTDMWSVGVICYVLLSGLSPFMGDNDMETMANVTRATFDFEDSSFDPISDLAKDFISKLLVSEQCKRLKPNECLKHPWLQRGGAELEASVRGRRESMHLAALQDIFPDELDLSSPRLSIILDTPPLQVSLDKRNLKKYVVRRKWHKTVHAIMALGRMGANLKGRFAG